MLRVIIPDTHGCLIDPKASRAFLRDLKRLDPREVILLGDHVDTAAHYSQHAPQALAELGYSYEADLEAAGAFLDAVQAAAPRARLDYIEGNHEWHVERLACALVRSDRDARGFMRANAPEHRLSLRARGIRYWPMKTCHEGLSIPGTIRRGDCYFTHGIAAGRNATRKHLDVFSANVVHGHTHRAAVETGRTVRSDVIMAACPGTLAQREAPYLTGPSQWTHGYAYQHVARSGRFLHVQVPIYAGESMLAAVGAAP